MAWRGKGEGVRPVMGSGEGVDGSGSAERKSVRKFENV
jgi:hypothetical protein